MSDHLIEIAFIHMPIRLIGQLLKDLSHNGERILSYNLTNISKELSWNSTKSLEKFFSENKNFALFINLKELQNGGLTIPNCGIAIYKDESTINFEINFQLSDLKNCKIIQLPSLLLKFAKSISARYKIKEYFCGLEPAEDIKTRLFTQDQLGPLTFKET